MSEYLDIPALYGARFSEKEMRARLPREIYKRLSASMATGEELDPTVADAGGERHEGMGDRAGGDALHPLVSAADGHDRREARLFH